jgi:broad specificity phosphatase PhoE
LTTLYLVRHGQCRHNAEHRIAAQNDSPLTPLGREQARANGRLLKSLAGDLSAFEFAASSLHRCCATMELLREAAGLDPFDYLADRRLMEIDMGNDTWLAGRTLTNLGAAHWDYVRPDGESMAQVHARVGAFLSGLTRDAVLVTHEGPLRMIRMHVLGLARQEALDYRPPNAGIMRLSAGSEAFFGE